MKNKSRYLSYLLRHKPEDLYMDKNGWINVDDILNKLNISFHTLQLIVDTNDKKRFSFNIDKTMIRANQGHSIKIDLELEKKIPPKFLYHGTASANVKNIKKKGLLKMKRNHVHLSSDYETALSVAKRYCKNDKPYIFKINTTPMIIDDINFYFSKNEVWLVNFIDPKYLN